MSSSRKPRSSNPAGGANRRLIAKIRKAAGNSAAFGVCDSLPFVLPFRLPPLPFVLSSRRVVAVGGVSRGLIEGQVGARNPCFDTSPRYAPCGATRSLLSTNGSRGRHRIMGRCGMPGRGERRAPPFQISAPTASMNRARLIGLDTYESAPAARIRSSSSRPAYAVTAITGIARKSSSAFSSRMIS